jgi:hypothetical protein
MCADDLVNMLPYIIVKAKIPRFIAHARYIVYFHYTEETGDVFSMYKTNLELVLQRIADHVEESKTDKQMAAMGAEFEMMIEEGPMEPTGSVAGIHRTSNVDAGSISNLANSNDSHNSGRSKGSMIYKRGSQPAERLSIVLEEGADED